MPLAFRNRLVARFRSPNTGAQLRAEPEIGMLRGSRPTFFFARFATVMRTEEISQSKVLARIAELVIETRNTSGDDRSAPLREAPDSQALRRGHRSDIRENQHFECARFAIHIIDVHGNIRNTSPAECLYESAVGSIHQVRGAVAAIEIRVPLQPDHADVGERITINQVLLVRLSPLH